jgi:hypothetical protein
MSILTPVLRLQEATLQPVLSPISLRSGRDSAVDVVKGTACLLMVAAHVHFAHAVWVQRATMAAVLFFASTGMNLVAIVERREGQENRLAMNAVFLIFAGFADNYVQGTLGDCDVFQSAGMAILAMLILRRILPRFWTWTFPVPFLIHLANQYFHWRTTGGGIASFFLTPGLFPLLPWLSFYLLGAHLKKYGGQRQGWHIGAAALFTLAILDVFRPFQFRKFWMSPDYFLIGIALTGWVFAALGRWLGEGGAARLIEIRRWGANSLVFYILSNFVIRVLEMALPHGVVFFLACLALTALLLRPALTLQAWTARKPPGTVLATAAVVSLTVLAANGLLWPHSFYLHALSSFGLTFSFVACYPAWKNTSRAVAGLSHRVVDVRVANSNP